MVAAENLAGVNNADALDEEMSEGESALLLVSRGVSEECVHTGCAAGCVNLCHVR